MLTARDAVDDRVDGPRRRRRRLPRQAVLVRRAARPPARADRRAPAERPTRARGRRPAARPGRAPGVARRDRARALGEGVRAARALHAPRRAALLARDQLLDGAWDMAFESRSNVVDVYVRYLREKIDRPFGRDSIETVRGVGYRLRRGRVSALPIRLRLTLAFAVAMAARARRASACFVYVRVGDALLASVDQTLRAQAPEARRTLAATSSGAASTATSPAGRRSRRSSTPAARPRLDAAGLPPLLSAARRRRASPADALRRPSRSRGPDGDWRLLAVPTGGGACGRRRALARAARRDAHRLLRELLIAGAARAPARVARRLRARRRRAAPGRGDAPPRRRDHRADSPGAAARARGRDEISRLAETLNEMLGRLRGGVRARAPVRRRREPRAAHAARAAAHRARARAAPAALARRARGRACARPPRRPSGCRGSPRTCC